MNDATIGHNRPPEFERLKLREEELMMGANTWAKDHTFDPDLTDLEEIQKRLDRLSDFKIQFDAFWKEAEAARKVEKKPWDDGAQAVQDKYLPILKRVENGLDMIRARWAKWGELKQKRQAEAKAIEEARLKKQREEADKAARDAAELKRQAEAGELKGDEKVDLFAAQEKAERAEAAVKEQTKTVKSLDVPVKGGTGVVDGKKKSVSFRTTYTAKITDMPTAFNFFKRHPLMISAIANTVQRLADEACRKDPDDPPPGCETVTTKTPT